MNSRETLILHTLQFKQLHTAGSSLSADIVDKLLDADSKAADEITKMFVPVFLLSWQMKWSSWAE